MFYFRRSIDALQPTRICLMSWGTNTGTITELGVKYQSVLERILLLNGNRLSKIQLFLRNINSYRCHICGETFTTHRHLNIH
jgi:predicted SprT family Zn-dependent metalloprotease